MAFASFATDIVTPFALYAVVALGVAHALGAGDGQHRAAGRAPSSRSATSGWWRASACASSRTCGAARATSLRLPLFVLQLTFVMVPIRILAFATMLHQSWSTRPVARCPYELRHEAVLR